MYQIITDGSWDMGSERATRFGVDVVPYYVTMDGEHYLKEIEELDVRDFISLWWTIQRFSQRPRCRQFRIIMMFLKNMPNRALISSALP